MRSDAELKEIFRRQARYIVELTVKGISGTLGIQGEGRSTLVSVDLFTRSARMVMAGLISVHLGAHAEHVEREDLERGARFFFLELYRQIRLFCNAQKSSPKELHSALGDAARWAAQSWTDALARR